MKIEKRILILCAAMAFCSMLALLAVNSLLFALLGDTLSNRALPPAGGGENLFAVGEILNGATAASADWGGLEERLASAGFGIYVRREEDGAELSKPESVRITEYLRKVAPQNERVSILSSNRALMAAGRKMTVDGVAYDVVAYAEERREERDGKPAPQLFFAFSLNFVIAGFVSLIVILALSHVFTRSIVARIMTPVNKMMAGAKRIEGGNLSVPIDYESADEFGALCVSFNRMQSSLLAEREKNAAYERARIEMFADISHDIRTPLTSVKGFIKGIIDGVADSPQKRTHYLSIAYKKACDIDALLNKVSFFSKLETGNLPISMVRTDLEEYVDRFARDSYEDFDARVAFRSDLGAEASSAASSSGDPSGGPSVGSAAANGAPRGRVMADIDPDSMKRVLNNLLENAKKYGKASNVEIELTVVGDRAVLRFKDNGPGVEESKLPFVFDRFYRADEARSSKNNEGGGLGLYIVKRLVEAQGGAVSARNDNGFLVEISLPLARS